jgi:hypothetical protein
MNTADIRDRARRTLARVEEELEAAGRELASKSAFHMAAWQEYGSELCAGGMLKDEQLIQDRIDALRRDRDLIRACLADELTPTQPPQEKCRLEEIDAAVAALAAERKQLIGGQAERDRLADLLGVPRGSVIDQEDTHGQRLLPLK